MLTAYDPTLEESAPGGDLHWTERRDGHWVARIPLGHGHYELLQKDGVWHGWKMEPNHTPESLGSSTTLGGAMMAAKRDAASAGRRAAEDCGCPHSHPPEVPTFPCAGEPGRGPRKDQKWAIVSQYLMPDSGMRIWYVESFHKTFASAKKAWWPKVEGSAGQTDFRIAKAHKDMRLGREIRDPDFEYDPVTAKEGPLYKRNTRDPHEVEAGRKMGVLNSPKRVYEALHTRISKESQEVFLVIPLDLRGQPQCPPVEVARGQRDQVEIDPSDVFRPVIEHNAKGFLIVHCHPSGHAKPSPADKALTASIERGAPVALGQKGGRFVDHVIIASSATKGEYASYRQKWRVTAVRHSL